jgi:hypothetical protein
MKISRVIFILIFFLPSCKRGWTEKDRAEFLSACTKGATQDMGPDKARQYCNCMLEKIVSRYPNALDAKYLKYDTALARMARDCSKHP